MAYISPFTEGLDFAFKYDGIDNTQQNNLYPSINRCTAFEYITKGEDFSLFRHLLYTSKLTDIFNDPDLTKKMTLFLPVDDKLLKYMDKEVIINADMDTARKIVLNSTLPERVELKQLMSSTALKLNTMLRGQKLYTYFENGNLSINRMTQILTGDIEVNNAIIHIVDSISLPVLS